MLVPVKMLFSVTLILLGVVSFVASHQGVPLTIMDEHKCPGRGWVADYKKFRLSERKNSIAPSKQYGYGEFAYFFGRNFNKGETATFRGKVEGGSLFTITFIGREPFIWDGKGDVPLYIKHTNTETCFNIHKHLEGWARDYQCVPYGYPVGSNFQISVTALDDKFEIRYGNRKIADYSFRMPIDYIEFINVRFEVQLTHAFVGGRKFENPYIARFPDGQSYSLQIGNRVVLVGVPYVDNKLFEIYFHSNAAEYWMRGDNVFMHFKVNLMTRKVERNARINGKWGTMEDDGDFPFEIDVEFELTIVNTQEELKFLVNDKQFATFKHRTKRPHLDYDKIEVKGAVHMRSLVVCQE